METKGKDRWDKASIILQPVGGLLTALAVAALGFFGSQYLERRQAMETNVRLYSELMSQREGAESALRKDMFLSIIQSFLSPDSASLEAKLLNLELLTYNFHESLNLKPLFVHMANLIAAAPGGAVKERMERLYKVAREVTRKEMLVLEDAGKKIDRTVDLEKLRGEPGGIDLEGVHLTLDRLERDFRLVVKKADLKTREIQVRLEVRTASGGDVDVDEAEFWVGFFDFPMVDNTRLSRDQRCAVILNRLEEKSADLTLIFFPGSHASLREKPYYQEVLQNLLQTHRLLEQAR